jgi:hypothetical protein
MTHLIEIKIMNEVLMIGCDVNATVTEISKQALNEYEKAYHYETPKLIQHVKDKQGRILSGNLQLIGLNLEKYLEIILLNSRSNQNENHDNDDDIDHINEANNLNLSPVMRQLDPRSLLVMYKKWQDYLSCHVKEYCQNLSYNESPAKEIIEILFSLKHSQEPKIQQNLLQSYHLLLIHLLTSGQGNEILLFQNLLENGLCQLLLNTSDSESMLLCLKILFQLQSTAGPSFRTTGRPSPASASFSSFMSYQHLIETSVSQIIEKIQTVLIQKFPNDEKEILRLCREAGHARTRIMMANGVHDPVPVSLTPTSISNGIQSSGNDENENVKKEEQEEEEVMTLERIIELLSSSDQRSKEYGLENLSGKSEVSPPLHSHPHPPPVSSSVEYGRQIREGGVKMKEKINFLHQAVFKNHGSDSYELLRALFDCLKSSFRPPSQPPTAINTVKRTPASSTSIPLTCLIVESALCSEHTSIPLVTSSLKYIHQLIHLIQQQRVTTTTTHTSPTRSSISEEWITLSHVPTTSSAQSKTLESLLSDKWRLLLTLAHGNYHKYPELVEQSADILLLFTRACGWDKYRIKLDSETIIYFLNSDSQQQRPLSRTLLGLDYLIYCTSRSDLSRDQRELMNTSASGAPYSSNTLLPSIHSSNSASRRKIVSNDTSQDSNNVDTSAMFCEDNYLLLRCLWRWIIGNYGIEFTLKSLQCFATASVFISVKTFLMKFQIYDKVS